MTQVFFCCFFAKLCPIFAIKDNVMDSPLFVHVSEFQDSSFLFRVNNFPPGHYFPYHIHPEFELQYVECGHGQRLIGGVMEDFPQGVVHIVPGNVPHVWCYSQDDPEKPVPARTYTIQFRAEVLANVLSLVPELRGDVEYITSLNDAVVISGKSAEAIGRHLKSMARQDGFDRYISFLRILKEIVEASDIRHIKVEHINTENPRHMTKIQQVFAYIEANHDKDFGLDDVASHVNMDKSSFCKFFKQMTGRTFTAVVNDMRINRAALLLINNPSLSIAEIAYTVGYDSVSHFNHMFLKLKNETPSAYRAKVKAEPLA